MGVAQTQLTESRASINVARTRDGAYSLTVYVDDYATLPGEGVADTMQQSGPFLANVSDQLRTIVGRLTNSPPDEYTFELTEHEPPEYEGDLERVSFELVVSPEPLAT